MRILLDEDVPIPLRHNVDAAVETVIYRGWDGLSNGDLLRRAEVEYDVLLTLDTNLKDQQHLAQFDLAVIVLRAGDDDIKVLDALMPQVNDLLVDLKPGQLVEVYPPEQ